MASAGDRCSVRRMLIQQLENLQMAGLTHWPRLEQTSAPPPIDQLLESVFGLRSETATAGIGMEAEAASPALQSEPRESANETELPRSPESASNAPRIQEPLPEQLEPPPETEGEDGVSAKKAKGLSLTERRKRLAALAERVSKCTRCEELAATRTQTVFGVGNPQARIMFIGEAPGADEDKQGEPFVGRAGQLLNRIIEASQLRREDVYITNILKSRPPGNRNPTPQEAANCREYLDEQIEIVNPEYIVCWGSIAAKNLLETTESVGRMRGRFYEYGNAKVLCTYHPSYLLRNPPAKKFVWEDMKFLMRDMGIELDSK